MKKYLVVMISLLILLSAIIACGQNSNKQDENSTEAVSVTNEIDQTKDNLAVNSKLSIVTTIFPQYDFVRQIAGDKVDLKMLLKPGVESHSYEPTPQDIKTIQTSDLFIYTGGENDTWVEGINESLGSDSPETMKLIDLVDTVDEEIVDGMEDHAEHTEADVHEIDEHVWTSPVKVIEIVEQITEKLSEKDPANAEIYQTNSETYINQLKALDEEFKNVVKTGKRQVILFGDRFPFRYFADEYNLEYYAAFSGCSTDTEASAATVAFLIDKTKELDLPVVFSIEMSDEKIADSIVEATGAEKLTLHSIHNLSVEDLAENETYISLMQRNLEALKKALN